MLLLFIIAELYNDGDQLAPKKQHTTKKNRRMEQTESQISCTVIQRRKRRVRREFKMDGDDGM